MENKKVVIALGGNALEEKGKPSTAENQLSVVKKTAEKLAKISAASYEIAIVHGNGPQVGRILLASETAHNVTPRMPFDAVSYTHLAPFPAASHRDFFLHVPDHVLYN